LVVKKGSVDTGIREKQGAEQVSIRSMAFRAHFRFPDLTLHANWGRNRL
jgi:hypothetical protein